MGRIDPLDGTGQVTTERARLDPTVVPHSERRPATGLPAGSIGQEAFADPGAWVGFIELPPGASSGWHHHGEWDSYACVLAGVLRWEFGPDGTDAIEVRAGDTGRMPAHRVHRDVSAGTEPLSMILFRAGEGELTFDVDGPDATGASRVSAAGDVPTPDGGRRG